MGVRTGSGGLASSAQADSALSNSDSGGVFSLRFAPDVEYTSGLTSTVASSTLFQPIMYDEQQRHQFSRPIYQKAESSWAAVQSRVSGQIYYHAKNLW